MPTVMLLEHGTITIRDVDPLNPRVLEGLLGAPFEEGWGAHTPDGTGRTPATSGARP